MISTFSYCLGTSAANFLQTIMVISQVNMFTHNRIGVGSIQGSMACLCHPKMSPVRQQICRHMPSLIFHFNASWALQNEEFVKILHANSSQCLDMLY